MVNFFLLIFVLNFIYNLVIFISYNSFKLPNNYNKCGVIFRVLRWVAMPASTVQVIMSKENQIGGAKVASLSRPEYGGEDKRRFKRVSVLWSGEYSDSHGTDQHCVIYDVSVNGVRAKFDHILEIGARLVIKIAGGIQLLTEVVWARGETVGLRFQDNPDKLASIMAGVLPMDCLDYA